MKICGIYKITSPTKKIYIGKSIDIFKRWRQYDSLNCKNQTCLYNSLKKHGVKKHKFEIVCQCDKSELDGLERYYISLFQCFNSEYGLNLREGGEGGGTCSEETKNRLRDAAIKAGCKPPLAAFTGYAHTDESKQKMRDKKKGKQSQFKGKRHTEEAKEKNRQKHMGKPAWNKGKRFSEESRKKMSEAHRGQAGWNKGKKLSEETRRKMSESMKGRVPWNKNIKIVKKAA